jgi:hypothetical protein
MALAKSWHRNKGSNATPPDTVRGRQMEMHKGRKEIK